MKISRRTPPHRPATPVDHRIVPFDHPGAAAPAPGDDQPADESVTTIGPTLMITGEIHAAEHVIVNGRVNGTIDLPHHGVAIGTHGAVDGRIFARTVTILGTTRGTVTAEIRAELRETSRVTGRLVAARIAMEEGASFNGFIDTSRADIATRVARYRVEQKGGAASS